MAGLIRHHQLLSELNADEHAVSGLPENRAGLASAMLTFSVVLATIPALVGVVAVWARAVSGITRRQVSRGVEAKPDECPRAPYVWRARDEAVG